LTSTSFFNTFNMQIHYNRKYTTYFAGEFTKRRDHYLRIKATETRWGQTLLKETQLGETKLVESLMLSCSSILKQWTRHVPMITLLRSVEV